MAKARPIHDLSAAEPMAIAAARILEVRTEELREHSRDVLDTADIERVHAMRVATRRLRAALEVFEACFPKKLHKAALREVKALADALGERRDRDVAIESLTAFAEALPAPDRRGVGSLVDALRLEQARANEELRPFVASVRVDALCERLRELAAEARGAAPRTDGREPSRNGAGAAA
jgi:CHAD domain-containing protein